MQVILKEKIRNLGDLGQQVNVKPGFARNFLIPQDKALQATKTNMEVFESQRAELEKIAAGKMADAQARADKIEGLKLSITAKTGDGGKLFGSITTRDIADAAAAEGVEIDKHEIRLAGAIREIGDFEAVVHLGSDLDAKLTLKVKSDGALEFEDEELQAHVDAELAEPEEVVEVVASEETPADDAADSEEEPKSE